MKRFDIVGGYAIDLSAIPFASTVVSAGISRGFEFEKTISNLGCNVIAIDPSEERFEEYKTLCGENKKYRRIVLVRKIFSPAHEANKRVFVKQNGRVWTTCEKYRGIDQKRIIMLPTIGIENITNTYGNVSLLKLNIKGEEFKILKALDGIKQVCVRVFNIHTSYNDNTVKDRIERMENKGYKVINKKLFEKFGYTEVVFVKGLK